MNILTVSIVSLGLGTLATAQTQCATVISASAQTNLFEDLSFQQFDPALGVLSSIDFTLSVDAMGFLNIENTNPNPETFNSVFSVRAEVREPATATAVETVSPSLNFTDTLAAYDGGFDFFGPSATVHTSLQLLGSSSRTVLSNEIDFTPFIGVGTVDVPVAVLDTTTVTAPGTYVFQSQETAFVTLEVCYNFTDPVPGLCAGDGGDQMGCTDCPCGNNAPQLTIGGCLNSAGTSTRLLSSGTSSIAAMDLRFEASGAPPNNSAVLTSGSALAPANMANPCFGLNSGIQSVNLDGLRCVVQGVLRHGVRPSDMNGDIGVTTNGWGTPNGFFNFAAFVSGETRHFQIIHRDDVMQVCQTGQNTSQAESVSFTP